MALSFNKLQAQLIEKCLNGPHAHLFDGVISSNRLLCLNVLLFIVFFTAYLALDENTSIKNLEASVLILISPF